mmetsp:Transcript_17000/g.43621  ORF Transcript_17000/g.43621 Transcript_17000/m.43621 type:complete len:103 (-) Transcript_17000:62-370(-)
MLSHMEGKCAPIFFSSSEKFADDETLRREGPSNCEDGIIQRPKHFSNDQKKDQSGFTRAHRKNSKNSVEALHHARQNFGAEPEKVRRLKKAAPLPTRVAGET